MYENRTVIKKGLLLQEKESVEKYHQDSVALKKHIKHLQDEPIEFRGTVCDTCHQTLSMPALYFLCQHSYHQELVLSVYIVCFIVFY